MEGKQATATVSLFPEKLLSATSARCLILSFLVKQVYCVFREFTRRLTLVQTTLRRRSEVGSAAVAFIGEQGEVVETLDAVNTNNPDQASVLHLVDKLSADRLNFLVGNLNDEFVKRLDVKGSLPLDKSLLHLDEFFEVAVNVLLLVNAPHAVSNVRP